MAKNLIIYYSRKGENYWNGGIKNIAKGNTEIVAEFIQKAVGGDLFEVDNVKTYAADYYACIDEAKKELHEQARPELTNTLSYSAMLSRYLFSSGLACSRSSCFASSIQT